jgi:SAM-dependent methyltransferase
MKQRLEEWKNLDENSLRYHLNQWETPKESTVAFGEFIEPLVSSSSRVIDIGAGSGGSTAYLANRHSKIQFTAFDISSELIAIGARIASEKNMANLCFRHGDLFEMQDPRHFDGCISLQTLSWMPNFEGPLGVIFEKINPKWLAVTSLFYEGDISSQVEVTEHQRNRKFFCNTYSLPSVSRFCEANHYSLTKAVPFQIKIDLEKPKDKDSMGTYTRRVVCNTSINDSSQRLQISGPLLMNWYMVLIERMR